MAAVLKLNPYLGTARKMATLAEAARVKAKKEKLDSKRTKLSPVRTHPSSISVMLSLAVIQNIIHWIYYRLYLVYWLLSIWYIAYYCYYSIALLVCTQQIAFLGYTLPVAGKCCELLLFYDHGVRGL
jgi:hypothetical protein